MDARVNRDYDWEDLDVTKEELDNINQCLKNKEFRELLMKYIDDINSPDNRKIYQDELTQLEKERGVDVKFVNPEPGYVIKTTCNGDRKCFINISKSDNIDKPTSKPSQDDDKVRGLQWSLPYSLSPPRDDVDKKKQFCTVFDVVFNPDTLHLASKNPKFRKIVNETAMDGIENNFKVKLDRNNLKFPKLNYKGISQSTVIRKKSDKPADNNIDIEPEIYQKLMSSYDESRNNKKSYDNEKLERPIPLTKYTNTDSKNINYKNIKNDKSYTKPKFIIKHQTDMDIQDFKNTKDSKLYSTTPNRLEIVIDLPLLKTSDDAILDVQNSQLTLISEKPAKYRLDLSLPYYINPDEGHAKFDVSNKKLTITLPVLRDIRLLEVKTDSGFDSDQLSPPNDSINGDNNFDNNDDDNDNSNDAPSKLFHKITDNIWCLDITINDDDYPCEEHILNDNIQYQLPSFTPNIFNNTLALTVHVKNVDSTSIRTQFVSSHSGLQITFASVGAGFYPVYYALFFTFGYDILLNDTMIIEPWDNNVVFTIQLKNTNNLKYYEFGSSHRCTEQRALPHMVTFQRELNYLMYDSSQKANEEQTVKVLPNYDEVVVNIQPKSMPEPLNTYGSTKYKLRKTRSMSESSGDGFTSSSSGGSDIIIPMVRGILKNPRDMFSRSLSKSRINNKTELVSSVDDNDDSVAELNSETESFSFKKTVRFNDVVTRQLFRSNSSILGRKKKNKRKLQKKKQAHDRRMSESENSETEERDKYKVNNKINHINNNKDNKDDKGIENIKPILNREKSVEIKTSDNLDDESKNNPVKLEFKNDLIFELDM